MKFAGIVGAGTMGCGIAMTFAAAGIDAVLIDADPLALERADSTLQKTYAAQVARGKVTPDQAQARLGRILLATAFDSLAQADVAIEAVFEDLVIKQQVFARLGGVCRPNALLATNTSTLDIDAIAAAAPRPQRTIGMHFFSPAHVMRLLEVVRGKKTSGATIDAAVTLGERLGKIPIVVGNCDGFVGNRMLLGYKREAELIVLGGAAVAEVDAALERFGFAMGPFAVSDLAGIDVGWRAKQERMRRGTVPPFALTEVSDAFVAAGRLGQKSGRGYYRYLPNDRARYADPEADALIARERQRAGLAQRVIGDEEIVERCLFALVNEGARILGEGIASSADDIDSIWVHGYGFPRERGGPMRYAKDAGLVRVLAAIERLAQTDVAFWKPAPALIAAAASGDFKA